MVIQEYGYDLHGGQEGLRFSLRRLGRRWGSSAIRLMLATGLGGIYLGCAPEAEAPPAPPGPLVEFISPASVEVVPSVPGLAYYNLTNQDHPWVVHLLRVELSRCELGFRVLEAPVGGGQGSGRSRVSELAGAAGNQLVAAVNGDFFSPEGLPLGTEVVAGQTRRLLSRPAFAWHPARRPWVGVPAPRGDSSVVLGWEMPRFQSDGATEVISGFPLLLSGGNRVGDLEVSERPGFAAERHPRTAIGIDVDGGLLWIVVVDGRQPAHSVGMTLPELASLFQALEVDEAINLDGGGSSVMILNGIIVSSPSDAEGERPVANALGIRLDRELCNLPGRIDR